MKFGKTIQCNTLYQSRIVQKFTDSILKMATFKMFDTQVHRNGLITVWYFHTKSDFTDFKTFDNNPENGRIH